jgi:calcineurin-like phosphoesterase family protein
MAVHEKWFISDTHFFHANILKFTDDKGARIRPFQSLDEMHETIVRNWNTVIGHNDYVYHLGDVTFQYHKPFQELMYSLKGNKRLILGNHDKVLQPGLLKHFNKVMTWHGFKEEDFTATHFPHMLHALRDGDFNVHGHIHQNKMNDPHYINVCVETRDYKPVHMDTIREEIKIAKQTKILYQSSKG